MRRGSLALRSLPDWPTLGRERKISERIPVIRIRDGQTLVTKDGDLARCFRLDGITTGTLADEQVLGARDALANLYRQHGRSGTAFTLHTIRRRVPLDDAKSEAASILSARRSVDGFPGYVEQLRRAEFADGLVDLSHVLTVLQRPGLRARSLVGGKQGNAEVGQSDALRRLDETGLAIETLLARLGPEPLRFTETESGLADFLSLLVNGTAAPMRPASAGLDVLLPTHRTIFRGETIELRGPAPEDTRFAAILALKAYGDRTSPDMLDPLLSASCDFILSQSFVPREVTDTLSRMKWTRRKMDVGEDEARSLADELESAMDDVASGRELFGDHHLSLAVLADSEEELAAQISDLSTVLTSAGLRPVREDTALEAAWWAQLPGNHAYRARTALISARNFADLAPCHAMAKGHTTDLTWDAPIALMESETGTPYWFSFHGKGRSANGNTLIFGPTGAGKTALIGFLVTSALALPRPPRIFYFDKDRGAEATIRALGGTYTTIHAEDGLGFNPFREADDKRGQAWLRDWIAARLGRAATPLERRAIAEAVAANAETPIDERCFSTFAIQFGEIGEGNAIADALDEWHSGGARSWLFDAAEDALDLSHPVTGFDMTAILRDATAADAFIDYLFHRLDRALESGEPTIIVLDEAWRLLKSGALAAKIEDWLKTVRKLNGLVVFLTQEPEDASRSEIAPAIVNSTMTKIFFPNETASAAVYRDVFGLTERELDLLRSTPVERRSFLVKQGSKSSFVRLDLSSAPELLKVFSGTAASVAELTDLRARFGADWLTPYMETN